MGSFLRSKHPITDDYSFVQGAGRILIAPDSQTKPDGIGDVLVLAAGATQFDPVLGWTEVGFTTTGINVTRNNSEEEFGVDQQRGAIRRRPGDWDMSVGTQLAEASLETFALAWELPHDVTGDPDIATVVNVDPELDERQIGLNAPVSYIERRLAVVFQFDNGAIRMWYFHRVTRAPQESGFTLQKTGEQVSLPMRWNCLIDSDEPDDTKFGYVSEQVAA
jgi:hypothetical protein